MIGHSHDEHDHAPRRGAAKRQFSLAQQSAMFRIVLAALLIAGIWAAIVPLVS